MAGHGCNWKFRPQHDGGHRNAPPAGSCRGEPRPERLTGRRCGIESCAGCHGGERPLVGDNHLFVLFCFILELLPGNLRFSLKQLRTKSQRGVQISQMMNLIAPFPIRNMRAHPFKDITSRIMATAVSGGELARVIAR